MVKVRIYQVTGITTKPNFKTKFQREIKATKKKDAVEKIFRILGSKHSIKRCHIKIEKIEEINFENSDK
jgi:large subunit ribosomal protein LX